MHVVVSAIWYPVAIARYILAALNDMDGVEVTTVGVATGTYIPWGGGMRLPESYVYNPDIVVGKLGNHFVPISMVEARLPKPADVWLQVDAGFYLQGRPRAGRNVVIGTDPHALNYDRQRVYADDFYCMQTPYMKHGDKYLPYAYDEQWHAPLERNGEFGIDVAMVGVVYPNRQQFIRQLSGLRIHAGCGNAYGDARHIYENSAVSFNLSSALDLTARVFELAAMGVPFAANDVPDMKLLFGDEVLSFAGTMDGARLVRELVNNADMRMEVAKRARRAVQGHTWGARVAQIMDGGSYEIGSGGLT